jgi:hypothetical protein
MLAMDDGNHDSCEFAAPRMGTSPLPRLQCTVGVGSVWAFIEIAVRRCRVRFELRSICWMALAIQPLCRAVHADADAPRNDFAVGAIRVEGLQRLSEGTVLNYLPMNIGDHVDGQGVCTTVVTAAQKVASAYEAVRHHRHPPAAFPR